MSVQYQNFFERIWVRSIYFWSIIPTGYGSWPPKINNGSFRATVPSHTPLPHHIRQTICQWHCHHNTRENLWHRQRLVPMVEADEDVSPPEPRPLMPNNSPSSTVQCNQHTANGVHTREGIRVVPYLVKEETTARHWSLEEAAGLYWEAIGHRIHSCPESARYTTSNTVQTNPHQLCTSEPCQMHAQSCKHSYSAFGCNCSHRWHRVHQRLHHESSRPLGKCLCWH